MANQEMQAKFGRVGVLMGGWAAEREVSLRSGQAVLEALQAQGVDAHGVDVDRNILATLQAENFDRVFNILHGRGGEDGELQGALEILQIPYTGCGVMASAICMDKLMTKTIWQGMGLPTPKFELLTAETDFAAVVERLSLPLIVKPATEGSSIGMSKVNSLEALEPAYHAAAEYTDLVFAEQWITGEEYTAAILVDEALPLIRLETPHEFYDFEAKYQSNETSYHCPCGLASEEEKAIQTVAKQAFAAVGGEGWGRIDFMRDEQGGNWLIEVNTAPGMTDHSLVPMAAKATGVSFEQLVVRILETTLD